MTWKYIVLVLALVGVGVLLSLYPATPQPLHAAAVGALVLFAAGIPGWIGKLMAPSDPPKPPTVPPGIGMVVMGLVLVAVAGVALASCSPAPLTPAETTSIVETSAGIAKCQAEGRRTNSFRAYSACMCAEKLHSDLQCAVDSASAPLVTDAGKDVGHGDQ